MQMLLCLIEGGVLSVVGWRVGNSEIGPCEIWRKICWELQWWEQTQAFHSHCPHWRATCGVPGESVTFAHQYFSCKTEKQVQIKTN